MMNMQRHCTTTISRRFLYIYHDYSFDFNCSYLQIRFNELYNLPFKWLIYLSHYTSIGSWSENMGLYWKKRQISVNCLATEKSLSGKLSNKNEHISSYCLNGLEACCQGALSYSCRVVAILRHTGADKYNRSRMVCFCLVVLRDSHWKGRSWFMDTAEAFETSVSGRRGAEGGWDAPPLGSGNGQPAVVPQFPW